MLKPLNALLFYVVLLTGCAIGPQSRAETPVDDVYFCSMRDVVTDVKKEDFSEYFRGNRGRTWIAFEMSRIFYEHLPQGQKGLSPSRWQEIVAIKATTPPDKIYAAMQAFATYCRTPR